jgi:cytochrome c oxidase assembly protein subunit 15
VSPINTQQAAGDFAPAPFAPARGAGLIRLWLLLVAVMVYGMILVGGATRLTDSGLSITEWKPLLGAFPPMNEAAWGEAFEKYRSMTAQSQHLNPNMDLAGFKGIYWWEWSHRELGRTIGVVFALPLIFFIVTKRMTRRLLPHLLVLFAMGGLQGLIGWWMVSSGVNTDLTSVAPERLMTHFGLALAIIAYCIWLWHELGAKRVETSRAAGAWAISLLTAAAVQMMLGALVAGLDAGRSFTDWPLMAGRLAPDGMWGPEPLWRNAGAAQFLHRMTGYGLLAASAWSAWKFRKDELGFGTILGLMLVQAMLGIVTLINAAPVGLSLMHQALGTVVLLACVRLAWMTRPTYRATSPAAGAADEARQVGGVKPTT